MQDSARAALSWLQAHAAQHGIDPGFRHHTDVHLHVQADAALKDGASAGVAMVAALVSTCTDRPIRPGLAMTGRDHPLRTRAPRRRYPGQGARATPRRPRPCRPAPAATARRSNRISVRTCGAPSPSTT